MDQTADSPVRPRDREAAQAALMEAAAALFAIHGYKGATLDAIAERSGLNKAMVRYYFGGKAGLYDAVLAEAIGHIRQRLEAVPSVQAAPERLDAHIEALAEGFAARPHFPAMLAAEYLSGGNRIARRETGLSLASFFERTRAILDAGKNENVFRGEDPHQVHLLIAGALIFFQLSEPFRKAFDLAEVGASRPGKADFVATLKRIITAGLELRR